MGLVGITDDHRAFRTDNVRRAVPPAPYWFSFVEFNDLAVIGSLGRFNVCRKRIR
jgi:hypothetical protein